MFLDKTREGENEMEFKNLTVIELNKKYKSGELKVVDVVSSILDKIEKKDKEYNCYITIIEKENLIKKAE